MDPTVVSLQDGSWYTGNSDSCEGEILEDMFPKNYTKTEEHFTVRNFYGRPSLTTAFRAQYDWYVQSKSSFRNCLFV
jgi:hypothetical protein